MTDFGNVLLVALGIGLLIFVHELGHYLAARWIGARVEVFSLGFGPRVWGWRRGATDYRLSLIPLGGYVAVAGQDPGDHRFAAEQSLYGKTVGQRALFFCGGVVMNVLFALIAFPLAFRAGVSFPAPEIGSIEPGSGAWEARLLPGDRILAIDGKQLYSFDNLQVEVALAGGRNVDLRIERGGEQRTFSVRPQFRSDLGFYIIGVDAAPTEKAPVLTVAADGPAASAGLRSGDELLAIDGHDMVGRAGLVALADADVVAGAPQTVRFRRNGAEQQATVTPGPGPEDGPPQIGVSPLACAITGFRGDGGLAAALGVEHGDVLLAVDGVPFVGPDLGVARDGPPELTLHVRRGGRELDLRAAVTPAVRAGLGEVLALRPDTAGNAVVPARDGAAMAAGMRAGDRIVRIDGAAIENWTQLRERVLAARERPMAVVVARPGAHVGETSTLELTLAAKARPLFDYGFSWQIEQKRSEVRADGFVDALRQGSVCALDLVKQLYVTMKRLLTGDVAAKNLGGIIQISRTSYQNTQWGLPRFVYFLALLSINLAFINVLPIPVLDGGHLLFLLIEKIKGSPVSVRVLNYSQLFGLALVLALVLFVTYNDILRLL